jgi:hypothetical protein
MSSIDTNTRTIQEQSFTEGADPSPENLPLRTGKDAKEAIARSTHQRQNLEMNASKLGLLSIKHARMVAALVRPAFRSTRHPQ